MLLNNLAYLPDLAFFRRSLTFFSKGVWQPCGCQHSYSQRQKIALRLPKYMTGSPLIKMTSASNYNRFVSLAPLT